jgi:hypothetical protein
MTGRGRAVILKFNFSKSCDHKKCFLLGHSVRNSNVHPVDSENIKFKIGRRSSVILIDPIFNREFFSKKKNSIKNLKKHLKNLKFVFFGTKLKQNRQYQVKFVFCYPCAL